jgi:tRNA A37 threonylcarbamoyltransferase TsaD
VCSAALYLLQLVGIAHLGGHLEGLPVLPQLQVDGVLVLGLGHALHVLLHLAKRLLVSARDDTVLNHIEQHVTDRVKTYTGS